MPNISKRVPKKVFPMDPASRISTRERNPEPQNRDPLLRRGAGLSSLPPAQMQGQQFDDDQGSPPAITSR